MYPERERLPELEQLHYEIVEWIPTKSNGMARLVKARSRSDEFVTIKIARIDAQNALTAKHNSAIVSEAECLHKLAHISGVVRVLPIPSEEQSQPGDASTYSGTLNEEGAPTYLVQPFLTGSTLSRSVGTQPINPIVALQILHSLAETLQSVHDSGWIHRDLKPSNIMFAQPPDLADVDGKSTSAEAGEARGSGQTTPTLIDFGIAARVDEEILAEGTVSWMAPEVRQAFEDNSPLMADPSCDLYGLGLLLCYMLSGQRPVVNQSLEENRLLLLDSALTAIRGSIPPKSGAYKGVHKLLHLLLHEEPTQRPTAYALSNRAARILKALRHPVPASQRFAMHKKRYATPLWRIIGSIVVALISIFIGRQLFQPASPIPAQTAQVAVVEEIAGALVTPPAGFPSSSESPTATLLPASQTGISARDDGTPSANGQPVDSALSASIDSSGEGSNQEAAAAAAQSSSAEDAAELESEDSRSGWLPRFTLPIGLLTLFGATQPSTPTPIPPPTVTPVPTGTSIPAGTSIPTQPPIAVAAPEIPVQGAPEQSAAVAPSPPAQIGENGAEADALELTNVPEAAKVLEIIGGNHVCVENWRETDTWNKAAAGSRINIRWRQIDDLPYDVEPLYVLSVAVDAEGLTPQRAIPITSVIKGDGVEIDAVDAYWAINSLVDRNQVVKNPYVWGVFLIGESGRIATRVSPVCYFQLDGNLERSLFYE